MTTRQLRARLERLAPTVSTVLTEDRDAGRRRREELFYRKLTPAGVTEAERQELAELNARFADEDRDRNRLMELVLRDFMATHVGHGPLTDLECAELSALEEKYPPTPLEQSPFKDAMEALEAALAEW
jgi:hypothetical protein